MTTLSKAAKVLLDKLPNTDPEAMVEGGFNVWAGKVKTVEAEPDAEYGYQVKITSDTPDSKSGQWYIWLTFGKEYATSHRVVSGSKGGLFLSRVAELLDGKKFQWGEFVGQWVIWQKEHQDFGDQGVHDIWLPVRISSKELTKEDYTPVAASSKGEDEEDEEEASSTTFSGVHVRAALQFMDKKTDKAFRKAVVKNEYLEDTNIPDAVVDGIFQAVAAREGWVTTEINEDDVEIPVVPYDVIDMPEEEDVIEA